MYECKGVMVEGWRVYSLQFIVDSLRDYGKDGNHGYFSFYILTQITQIAQIFCFLQKPEKTLTSVYMSDLQSRQDSMFIFFSLIAST